MIKIFKKTHVVLIPVFFALLGYFYNLNLKDNWHYRYEIKKSFPTVIYLNSIDEKMVRLKVSDTTHIKFKDAVAIIITEKQNNLRKDFPMLRELNLNEKYISFRPEKIGDAENHVRVSKN